MSSPAKLAHAVLRTTDMAALVEWWSLALGATPRFGNEFITFLSYDDEHHRLAVVQLPGLEERAGGSVGVDHLAFTFDSVDALFAKFAELAEHDIHPVWTVDHGMTLSAYYEDPDRNKVEFQVDVCSLEEADDFMRSDAFAANPIGVDVDFDELIARRRAGADVEELVRLGAGAAPPR